MDEKMRFSVYCTELFRTRHALSGDQVMNLFRVYGVLDYLDECYGALHVMGADYILEDLESLIDEGGYAPNGSDRLRSESEQTSRVPDADPSDAGRGSAAPSHAVK